MEWAQKFEVGHLRIDMEHHVFFDLIQAMERAGEQGASRDKIRRIFAEVTKYAEFHFLSEENIMIDVAYPDLAAHHEHHDQLMRQLNHFMVRFEAGEKDIQEVVNFLYEWFSHHTVNEDRQLSLYIQQDAS